MSERDTGKLQRILTDSKQECHEARETAMSGDAQRLAFQTVTRRNAFDMQKSATVTRFAKPQVKAVPRT